jgi:hypothetical protein
MPMNLKLDLTEPELEELRQQTNATDSAGAVARAAREFLQTYRLRERPLMGGQLDYVEVPETIKSLVLASLGEPQLLWGRAYASADDGQ